MFVGVSAGWRKSLNVMNIHLASICERALEPALKTLLDRLKISYKRKNGKSCLHNVSGLIAETCKKLEPRLEGYDEDYALVVKTEDDVISSSISLFKVCSYRDLKERAFIDLLSFS
ncbi:MAG: hypothetical protein DRN61_06325 [Thaumarchaeota archaeon]|nr:MAG: hypothetical protein DRN61_06325 [Nitrososphaerota archaeon]